MLVKNKMKVQLNFRDTTVSLNNGIYTVNFNISKYVKLQQLSSNARCYIESVNLLDMSQTGYTKTLEGSFDIHANFVNNNDISTSENVFDPVIFNHTLYESGQYQNNNGMYNLNYKVNENVFKSGNLQLTLVFYDASGDIYYNHTFINTLDTTNYPLYLAQQLVTSLASKAVGDKKDEIEEIEVEIQLVKLTAKNLENAQNNLEQLMYIALANLETHVSNRYNKARSSRSITFWGDYLTAIEKPVETDNPNQIHLIYNLKFLPLTPQDANQNKLPPIQFILDFVDPFKEAYKKYFSDLYDFSVFNQTITRITNDTATAIMKFEVTKQDATTPAILYSDGKMEHIYWANKKGENDQFNITLILNDTADEIFVIYIDDNSGINFVLNDIIEIQSADLKNYDNEDNVFFNNLETDIPRLELKVIAMTVYDILLTPKQNDLVPLIITETTEQTNLNNAISATTLTTNQDDFIKKAIKGMSLSLVLYDELDEFKSNGKIENDHNLNRNTNCVFRRI